MDAPVRIDAIQDIHICGACRRQFSDVEVFVNHKNHGCPVLAAIREADATSQQVNQVEIQAELQNPELTQTHDPQQDRASLHDLIQQPQGHDYIRSRLDVPVPEQQVLTSQFTGSNEQIVVQLEPGGGYIGLPQNVQGSSLSSDLLSASQSQAEVHTGTTEYLQASIQTASSAQTVYQPSVTQREAAGDKTETQSIQTQQTGLSFHSVGTNIEYEKTQNESTDTVYCLVSQETVQHGSSVDVGSQQHTGSHIPDLRDTHQESRDQYLPHAGTCPDFQEGDGTQLLPDTHDSLQQAESGIPVQTPYRVALEYNSIDKSQVSRLDVIGFQDSGRPTDNYVNDTPIENDGNFQTTSRMYVQVSNSSTPQKQIRQEKEADKAASEIGKNSRIVQFIENDMYLKATDKDSHPSSAGTSAKRGKGQQTVTGKGVRSPLEKRFKCHYGECEYRTAYLKDLERHHRVHTGEKPFVCKQCGKSFNRSDKLMLHMRYHMGEKPYQCQLCSYSAVESGSLKKHMRIHTDSRPYKCQVCPYQSRSSSQLMIHLRSHTGDTPYQCNVCNAFFKVTSDLKRHMRIHTGEKPFHCEYCDYRCSIKGNLRSHYKINHSETNQSQCEVCNFQSSSKRAFREHMKTHEVKTDLICKICQYQCSTKSALKNHLRMHSGEKPFECDFCDYTSKQSGNIMTHMRRRHPEKLWLKTRKGKVIERKKYVRHVESEAFAKSEPKTGKGLLRLKGKCAKMFNCDLCDAAFVREDSLKCHLRYHKDNSNCSLSTAYAVLKLQQPVINNSNQNQNLLDPMSNPHVSENLEQSVDLDENIDKGVNTSEITDQYDNDGEPAVSEIGDRLSEGSQPVVQTPVINLGINDILAAAGMAGLGGVSQTAGRPEQDADSEIPASQVNTVDPKLACNLKAENNNSEADMQTSKQEFTAVSDDDKIYDVRGQVTQEIPTIQVMQNLSLPYIRLANGQILLMSGQSQVGQVVSQLDSSIGQNTSQPLVIQTPSQSVASVTPPTSVSSPPQQPGAIPIQIILPSDSQQAMPIVSQLLDTVMSKVVDSGNTSSAIQVLQHQNVPSQLPTKTGQNISDSQQILTVQVPGQPAQIQAIPQRSVPETQNFIMQIPGHVQNTADTSDVQQSFVVQIPGNAPISNHATAQADGQQNFVIQIPGPDGHQVWSNSVQGSVDKTIPVQLIEYSGSLTQGTSSQDVLLTHNAASRNQSDVTREPSED